VLHGLAALHAQNQVAFQVLHGLTKAGGEGNAESALAAAGPQVLFEAMSRILSAARQIETLVDTLNLHMTTLLRLVERAESYIDPAIDPNSASR